MSLTDAQGQAIAARGNVLVIAGAGAGKTRTLVERCLQCVLEEKPPVSLEELLVVTFTEAAAAEMRQRLRSRLEEEAARQPEEFRWQEQLALFERAHFGTIHSFCLQLLRPHFYELELDPQLSVLAPEEAHLLEEETLTTLLTSYYSGPSDRAGRVQRLIQDHGGGNDQPIRRLVLRLHHYSQTQPNSAKWYEDQMAMFGKADPVAWREWLLRGFLEWREEWLAKLKGWRANPLAETAAGELQNATDTPAAAEMSRCLQHVLGLADQKVSGQSKTWRKAWKKFQADAEFLLALANPELTPDPLAQDWNWVRAQMTTLLELASEFGRAFSENKRELGMVDFHDLEQHALRLLWDSQTGQPSRTAELWRKKLRFIFVDEYQDINPAQDRIIQALSREKTAANRFLVGDVKQSIYRFRLANPRIFQEYARTWRNGLGQTVPLVENFRSREAIVNFINSFFPVLMRKELGGIEYDQSARLQFGAPQERRQLSLEHSPGPCVELHLRVQTGTAEPDADDEEDPAMAELLELEESEKEALVVASRLRELRREQLPVWDTGQFRPVEWRDMAVLLRSPGNKAESYAKAFSRMNVPLVVQRSGFYESTEILDLLSLLQILDNPLQDVPVLAVLHSPLVGLGINELATIRLAAKGPFWAALVLWSDHAETKLKAQAGERSRVPDLSAIDQGTFLRVRTFLDRFGRWRRLARQASLSQCLEAILAETQYETWLASQDRGAQRQANVQRLLALTQQFDQFQRQGLFRFLGFVEAQKEVQLEPEVKAASEENAIRLLSIHQSKGLEFPVVCVADLGKAFNLEDLRAAIILDEEYGVCPLVKPPQSGTRYPSLPYWLARRRQHQELLGEELRLLYVAMTRARDRLLLSASVRETRLRRFVRGMEDLGPAPASSASSASDWIAVWFAEHCHSGSQTETNPTARARASRITKKQLTPLATPGLLPGDNALLRWFIHKEATLLEFGSDSSTPSDERSLAAPGAAWEQLWQRLSWRYPFQSATRTPAKASVTLLRHQASAQLPDDTFQIPNRFVLEKKKTATPSSGFARLGKRTNPDRANPQGDATEVGNAHHRFLQLFDLKRAGSAAELKQESARLSQQQALTPEEVKLLDFAALAAFWQSDLGREILGQAQYIQRELAFTARFSPAELAEITGEPPTPDLKDEFVIVQGVADLAVLLPAEIWLLDFKTDRVNKAELDAKARGYRPQMQLYARALSAIYRRPVKRCWLYFLGCSAALEVPQAEWDPRNTPEGMPFR